MIAVARTDTSVIGRWWWTVDRWTMAALAALIGIGIVLVVTASPSVAERISAEPFYFIRRHLILIPVAAAILFGCSLLSPRQVLRVALCVFIAAVLLLALTFVMGVEIKGARRWLNIAGFSLQPSELVKPSFAIVAAWLFAEQKRGRMPGNLIAMALFCMVISLTVMQPDLGMTVVIGAVFMAQFFLAGLPIWLVGGLGAAAIGGIVGAYFTFPHVTSRIDRFLDPAAGDNYQINTSINAFMNGGLFGRGPGVGRLKEILPDGHADFVFAVAGEELGMLFCALIVGLFAFVVLRGFTRLLVENNFFVFVAVAGLLTQFGLQAFINMASALHLVPTKGMTLPFISYGGSSLLALSLSMGMVLALTRRRVDAGGLP